MKISVLGCGKMGEAVVKGLYKSDSTIEFLTYTPSFTRAELLAKAVSGSSVATIQELPESDYYLLACKPQQFEALAVELIQNKCFSSSAKIISLLAGTTTHKISDLLKVTTIIRVMPNTPCLVGAGVNAFYITPNMSRTESQQIIDLFSSFSKVFLFEKEEEIDVITGFSGSGPAYIFEFARIMIDEMITKGISSAVAKEMVTETFFGASKLMCESNDDPLTLRNNVTSKAGVTYEALKVFREHHLEEIFHKALESAHARSVELSLG